MADNDDDEIGRQIVGAVRREIEPTHGATIVDLQKSTEQLAFAAARATAAKPALQGGPKIAFFDRAGFAGPDLVGGAHGHHHLALFELPGCYFLGAADVASAAIALSAPVMVRTAACMPAGPAWRCAIQAGSL